MEWSDGNLREFLGYYGIAPSIVSSVVLEGGCDNLNLLIDADGEKLVLRRYNITDECEVDFELELVRFLSDRRFPTAPLLVTQDGRSAAVFQGKRAALFGFVAGKHPETGSVAAAEQIAKVLADLHTATRDIEFASKPRSRTDMNRLNTLESLAADGKQQFSDPDLKQMLRNIRRFRENFMACTTAHADDLPKGVVHHDVNDGNVLFNDEGRLVALLDFDEAHISYLLTDLASLIHYWAIQEDECRIDSDRAHHLISVYDAHRYLTDAEREILPIFVLLFHLADAAEYVSRSLRCDPTGTPVGRCRSYQVFLNLTADETTSYPHS